jgi:hypothetical protein
MIYITLTTIPDRLKRFNHLQEVLNSLLCQETNNEYFVILSIPPIYNVNGEKYEIPVNLLELRKNEKLIIDRTTPDYGQITKLVSSIKFAINPDDVIIALDDDYIYHENMLEYHIKKLNEYPNHAICFNGFEGLDKRTWIENNEKKFLFRKLPLIWPTDKDRYVLIPQHRYSISYKRKYFTDDFNENMWSISHNDDFIIAYYLKKHEIWPICVKWDGEIDFRPRPMNQTAFPIVRKISEYAIETREKDIARNKNFLFDMKTTIKDFLYDFDTLEGKSKIFYTEKL